MAYTSTDPMNLRGEALRGWYLQSPEEIEQRRQAAQAQRYDNFFKPRQPNAAQEFQNPNSGATASLASPQLMWAAVGPNRAVGRSVTSAGIRSSATKSGPSGSPTASCGGTCQTANSRTAAKGIAACTSCHGRSARPLPLPFPLPWINRPVHRDIPRTPSADPPRGPPKQCEIQNARDTEICTRQPNLTARRMCHESASVRLAYCIKTKGEVGHPRLFTHPDGPQR